MGAALNPRTGSLSDTEEERQGHRGEATWRRRRRREGGGHQLRDGHLEPPEAGRGGEDPPRRHSREPSPGTDAWSPQKLEEAGRTLPEDATGSPALGRRPGAPRSWKRRGGPSPKTLQRAQPWDPLTSDLWSPGLGRVGGCGFKPPG